MKASRSSLGLLIIIVVSMPTIFSGFAAGYSASNLDIYAPPIIRFSSGYGNIENDSVIFDNGNFNITFSVTAPYDVYRYSALDTVMSYGVTITSAYYNTNWQPSETFGGTPNPITITNIPHGYRYIQVTGDVGGNLITGFSPFSLSPFTTTDTQTLYFTSEGPPTISTTAPQNQTYYSKTIPLSFNINGSYAQLDYSLDNQDKWTISGNTTLTGLPYGSHNLVVYASDSFGNTVVSKTIYFTVAKPLSFPTTTAIASIIGIFVIAIGLLIYSRHRKISKLKQ